MKHTNQFGQIVGTFVENWVTKPKPPQTALQGNHVHLTPLATYQEKAKVLDVLSIANQGDSWTYLPYGPFTHAEFEDWINLKMKESDSLLYAILDAKTQSPLGVCGYLRINPEHGVLEIGYLHFSQLLKKTIGATEAIYLLMQRTFDELGYRRCEWKCNSLNEASRRAALRFGFTFEGTFRQANVFKNYNRDTTWFSVLDSEWPALKMKFNRWLHPENFDVSGKQIKRLNEI